MTGPAHPLSPSAVRAAHAVRVGVGRMHRRLRERTDSAELTPSQASVLSRLDRDGPATASALAAAEGVRPQSVAATLAVLAERGMVTRSPDPADGRRQVVAATAHGRELLDATRAEGEQWLARALGELDDAERDTVVAAMALLARVADR